MDALADPFVLLLALGLALALLVWLNLQINTYTFSLVRLVTGSMDMATVILFLIYLPGILLHEGSHWLTARILGLRPSKFRVWPSKNGSQIGLGSVQMRSGGIWLDTLVGMAPLVAGTAVIAVIGHAYFDTVQLLSFWDERRYLAAVGTVFRSLGNQDGALFAYLLFAVSNAMLPSASDREPLKPVLLVLTMAGLLYFFLGLPATGLPMALQQLLQNLLPQTELLIGGLYFVIVLDAAVLAVLFILVSLIGTFIR